MNPVARVVSTVALAATGFFTLYAFQTLPADAQLAIHWDVNGVADGFAGREALFALPAVFVLTAALNDAMRTAVNQLPLPGVGATAPITSALMSVRSGRRAA